MWIRFHFYPYKITIFYTNTVAYILIILEQSDMYFPFCSEIFFLRGFDTGIYCGVWILAILKTHACKPCKCVRVVNGN